MYCFDFVLSYASDVGILFLKSSKILCLIFFFNKLNTDTVTGNRLALYTNTIESLFEMYS